MAGNFEAGETVICSITVVDSSGNLQDVATSMTITITNPAGSAVVSAIAMTNDGTGLYHYDYQTGTSLGIYNVKYIATDGSRITMSRDTFRLVS
jgi:uncharacterized protein YfaS (alpha-2-macroglobulin family)